MGELRNLEQFLEEKVSELSIDMRNVVNVKTGALKASIEHKGLEVEMLFYGQFPKVWNYGVQSINNPGGQNDKWRLHSPTDRISSILHDLLPEMQDMYKKDLVIKIKQSGTYFRKN